MKVFALSNDLFSVIKIFSDSLKAKQELYKLCGQNDFDYSLLACTVDSDEASRQNYIFCPDLTIARDNISKQEWDNIWERVIKELALPISERSSLHKLIDYQQQVYKWAYDKVKDEDWDYSLYQSPFFPTKLDYSDDGNKPKFEM